MHNLEGNLNLHMKEIIELVYHILELQLIAADLGENQGGKRKYTYLRRPNECNMLNLCFYFHFPSLAPPLPIKH